MCNVFVVLVFYKDDSEVQPFAFKDREVMEMFISVCNMNSNIDFIKTHELSIAY